MKKNNNSWIVLTALVAVAFSASACARRPTKAAAPAAAVAEKAGAAGVPGAGAGTTASAKTLSAEDCKKQVEAVNVTIEEKRKAAGEFSKEDQEKVVSLADDLVEALKSDSDFQDHAKPLSDALASGKVKSEKDIEATKGDRTKLDAALLNAVKNTAPAIFPNAVECSKFEDTVQTKSQNTNVGCWLSDKAVASATTTAEAPAKSPDTSPVPTPVPNAEVSGTFSTGPAAKAFEDSTKAKSADKTVAKSKRWLEIYYAPKGQLIVRLAERLDQTAELNGTKMNLLRQHQATRRFDFSEGVENEVRSYSILKLPQGDKVANPKWYALASEKSEKFDATKELLNSVINPECRSQPPAATPATIAAPATIVAPAKPATTTTTPAAARSSTNLRGASH